MAVPLTLHEQQMLDWFIPDHTLAVYFGMSKFDNVLKTKENGKLEQFMGDIPQAYKDCKELRACFEKYNIKSEEQVYDLSEDPTEKKVKETLMKICKKI